MQEENRMLQAELSRVEDLLAQSRADRDEIAIKYNAVSERVSRQYAIRRDLLLMKGVKEFRE